ncbi:MAG: hypothetical protein ACXU71_12230, partial [Croceibacterium sp.]
GPVLAEGIMASGLCVPHKQAAHMAAPTEGQYIRNTLANGEPSTHGAKVAGMSAMGRKQPLAQLTTSLPADLRSRLKDGPEFLKFGDERAQGIGPKDQRQFRSALEHHEQHWLALRRLSGLYTGWPDELLLVGIVELFPSSGEHGCKDPGALGAHVEAVNLLVLADHVDVDAIIREPPLIEPNVLQRILLT